MKYTEESVDEANEFLNNMGFQGCFDARGYIILNSVVCNLYPQDIEVIYAAISLLEECKDDVG